MNWGQAHTVGRGAFLRRVLNQSEHAWISTFMTRGLDCHANLFPHNNVVRWSETATQHPDGRLRKGFAEL